MNLESLIKALREHVNLSVRLADAGPFTVAPDMRAVDSYRGFYEDLAIGVTLTRYGPFADELADVLEATIGTKTEGYKGGHYLVTPSTRVWLSNYGEVSSVLVTGVREEDGYAVITWEKTT